jgi:dienelactone hydrolase
LNLYDFMRRIDYLHGLACVDSKRTGCIGLSNGGTFACHLAALDARITATVVSGAIGSWREQMWHSYACGNQVLHGIMQYADIADVAARIAPRALCVESSLCDSCFMSSSSRAAHAVLRRAYRVAGRAGRLCIDVFPGLHRFHGEKSLAFLRKHLGE